MYLTGTGTEQSFQKAVLYYTQALDRGHTPAAYSLAVMHLNGIGTVRDCDIAVNLLKKVCERGEWVSGKLVDAYEYGEKLPDRAALLFLKLAEAGHEVAQMNAAHLFDSGQSSLLFAGEIGTDQSPSAEVRHHSRTLAQRFYEMSAEQGGASSELRLGDYAYYGWGVSASFKDDDSVPLTDADDFMPQIYTMNDVELSNQGIDYEASLARYRKTAEMTVTGEWMQAFVARASFNLGFMYQLGLGVKQDLHTAKQHYHRCREVDPSCVHTPVTMVLLALGAHMIFLRVPEWDKVVDRLSVDVRVHILVLHIVAIVVVVITRCHLARTMRTERRTPDPPTSPPASASTQPGRSVSSAAAASAFGSAPATAQPENSAGAQADAAAVPPEGMVLH